MSASTVATPTTQRTVTVTFTQTDYPGGPSTAGSTSSPIVRMHANQAIGVVFRDVARLILRQQNGDA